MRNVVTHTEETRSVGTHTWETRTVVSQVDSSGGSLEHDGLSLFASVAASSSLSSAPAKVRSIGPSSDSDSPSSISPSSPVHS